MRWHHRDGETKYEVIIEPTLKAGYYDFTDVDDEKVLPEYWMKCKKRG